MRETLAASSKDFEVKVVMMLSSMWPYILVGVVLLTLLVAVLLYLTIRKGRKRQPEPETAAEEEDGREASSIGSTRGAARPRLRASFAAAVKLLKAHAAFRDYRYRIPWFVMLGEAGSGKTTLLANTGLHLPLNRPARGTGGIRQDVNWWFFDQGVVLDVSGDFVLRADGQTSDDRGWHLLLRLLQKHRPERPVDGFVLTIPCTDLIGAQNQSAEQATRIGAKAAHLYRKLWQAQKILGMRFPVYVVVTKCDQIAGFSSFCRQLPPHLHNNVFGWSSPYTPETAFQPGWVDEAFRSLQKYLYQAQFELFAEQGKMEGGADLFFFPSELLSIKTPIGIYLEQLFKLSAYHESLLFRGLYFCGDSGIPSPAAGAQGRQEAMGPPPGSIIGLLPAHAPAREPAGKRPIFIKDLFEKKVFPEGHLAGPVSRMLLSWNRTVLTAQALVLAVVLAGGIGLLAGYTRLSREEENIYKSLANTRTDLEEMLDVLTRQIELKSKFAGSLPDDETALRGDGVIRLKMNQIKDNASRLLLSMTSINADSFYSIFIPTSWFSGIRKRVEGSMVPAFQYVVFESIRIGLQDRARQMLGSDSDFRIQEFVRGLGELDKHIEIYNMLSEPNRGGLEELGSLIKYLNYQGLPANFDRNNKCSDKV